MLGLMSAIAIAGIVSVVVVAMWAAWRMSIKAGETAIVGRRWMFAALAAALLAIFWDWLPTWIAYEYYSQQAGFTLLKSLEQWKVENPGMASTLEPFQPNQADKRSQHVELQSGVTRWPLNNRFAYDTWEERPFLSVKLRYMLVIDTQTNEVLARYVLVTSGNSGGIATGGPAWWAFWLVHGPEGLGPGYRDFSQVREGARSIGGK
jgi:hypothetical protein